ncbi:MAG: FAD-binding oxidoreductase [Flavobacteriales bacterium]|nr:MAG: FAD-binding oxidoreductase [Flavobacteriales bacterium]
MRSIWQERDFRAPATGQSSGGGHAEVVIVGAGIVGLFTALHYKRANPRHRVVVLERGPLPDGATMRNAGFACFGSPSELLADMAKEGEEAALARVEERWLGLQELRGELGDDRIGFEGTGGYELFGEGDPLYNRVADGFDRLNSALRGIFGRTVYEWRTERIGDLGLTCEHLAFTPLEGPVHSGKLVSTLLAKASEAGVDIHFSQEVLDLEEQSGRVLVSTRAGHSWTGDRIVVATNGYAKDLLPELDVVPARGQVVVTSPIPGLKFKGTFHAHEGFYYFRDFEGGVLLGGGRHLDMAGEATAEHSSTPLIQQDLERMLREVILPGQPFTVAHRWAGIMGFRSTGKTPLVERLSERVVCAVGLSGMGVAIGIRVARKAARLVAE